MKQLLFILFLNSLLITTVFAQKSTTAIHLNNPLGMYQKVVLKLEYKHNQLGLLLTGMQFYGSLPKYPGTQVGFEGRHYIKYDSGSTHNNFIYSKLFYGYQQHVDQSGDGFFNRAEVPEGSYYGAGMGVGRHFNFGHFFFDLNTGLKYTFTNVDQATAFFITGPGSYFDLHFNLGYQF